MLADANAPVDQVTLRTAINISQNVILQTIESKFTELADQFKSLHSRNNSSVALPTAAVGNDDTVVQSMSMPPSTLVDNGYKYNQYRCGDSLLKWLPEDFQWPLEMSVDNLWEEYFNGKSLGPLYRKLQIPLSLVH